MFFSKRAITQGLLVTAVSLLSMFLLNPVQANPRYSSIVIDADSGAVLHQDSADAIRYPASLTKMMTLYMLFEAMERGKMTLDTPMKVSAHAAGMPQTNIGLRAGDSLKVRDAIPALVVRSANDAAAVVAEALGNSEANFGRMMTDKARQLGMRSTTFRNASGLPNGEQKTTARDMVTLATRLMKDFPKYYHYFSTQSFSYKGVTYNSHNRMVRNVPGVDGLKTGFIRASGFNVATSAKRGNRRVVAVVMGGHTAAARDQHMAQLIDRSLSSSNRANPVASQKTPTRVTTAAAAKVSAPAPAPAPVQKPHQQQPSKAEAVVAASRHHPAVPSAQTPPSPPQSQKAEASAKEGWAVQIGSYHEPDRARANAQAAARLIPGEVAVTEVEISNRKLYRARLVGLQENQARNACQSLTRQGFGCLVVRS